MTRILGLCLIPGLLLLACVGGYAAEGAAYKLEAGAWNVKSLESLTLTDAKQKKALVVRVHYPEGKGSFPILVFSHGFGAGKDAFSVISQHWASHGYVCIHPEHADAHKGSSKPGAGGVGGEKPTTPLRGVLQNLRNQGGLQGLNSPEKIAERVADVTRVLDSLDQIEKEIPALKGQLDRSRIGISGHSYGACVTMLLGGTTVEVKGQATSYMDPRVKCLLPISGAGSGEFGLTKDSWKNLTLPTLFITGTRDVRPGHEAGWRREPFDGCPTGHKFFLNIEGANHISFGGGPAGGRLANLGAGRFEQYTPLVKTTTVAFWDAYLKDEEKARDYLSKDTGFNAYAGSKAKLQAK